MPSPRRTLLRRFALATLGIGLLSAAFTLADAWDAMGKGASGERWQRMLASPQHDGQVFVNSQPLWNDISGSIFAAADRSDYASPHAPLPVVPVSPDRFAAPPESGLRLTWLGYSTLIIEIEGVRFLTDPIWGPRTSPLTWAGPKRWYSPPLQLDELPEIDAVLISHDHYDHLDHPTILALADRIPKFIAPLGVGAHLEYWGVAPEKIVEVDWWQELTVGAIQVAAVPSRHASGRQVFDQNATLWAGYALIGKERRAYFSGDTGMFDALKDIGDRYGPFDVAMIEVGAYHRAWPDWHIGPEQAIEANAVVRSRLFVPIHWGLFDLAMHGWTEPVERVLTAAEAASATVAVPRPGASIDPISPPPVERWWPKVPYETAEEHPIISTGTPRRPVP